MSKNYFRVKRKINNGVVGEGEECQKKTKVLIGGESENLIPSGSVTDTILRVPDNSVIEVDLYYDSDDSVADSSLEILLPNQEATLNKSGIREKIIKWTLNNFDTLRFSAVTDLLTILREERHTLPKTSQKLLGTVHRRALYPMMSSRNTQGELKQRNVEITDAEQNAENEENSLLFLTEEALNKELSDAPTMSKDIASAKKRKKKQSKNEPQVPLSSTDVQMQIKNDIEELMEEKFNKMTILIENKIESAKRSILYDIQSKIDELRQAVFQNSMSTASTSWLEVMKTGLNGFLPLKSLQNFIDFDEKLSGNDEYQEALIQLYKTSISSESSVMSAIKKIMKLTLEKAVELEYSGTGRTVQGIVAKRNFSATATYKCLDGAVSERFAGSDELKNLSGKVGRWLSGAGDRDGGRKNRWIK